MLCHIGSQLGKYHHTGPPPSTTDTPPRSCRRVGEGDACAPPKGSCHTQDPQYHKARMKDSGKTQPRLNVYSCTCSSESPLCATPPPLQPPTHTLKSSQTPHGDLANSWFLSLGCTYRRYREHRMGDLPCCLLAQPAAQSLPGKAGTSMCTCSMHQLESSS